MLLVFSSRLSRRDLSCWSSLSPCVHSLRSIRFVYTELSLFLSLSTILLCNLKCTSVNERLLWRFAIPMFIHTVYSSPTLFILPRYFSLRQTIKRDRSGIAGYAIDRANSSIFYLTRWSSTPCLLHAKFSVWLTGNADACLTCWRGYMRFDNNLRKLLFMLYILFYFLYQKIK